MKKAIILSSLIVSILTACKSLNSNEKTYSKKEWTIAYKNFAVIQTLRKTGIDLNKDNSGAIQFEILGANTETLKEIDSLSSIYSQSILSSPSYFEGKPIIIMVLDLYNSKKLNNLACKSYKKTLSTAKH
ncbi:MAG: hypothetical protein ACI7YS_12145 [Flavobacterium sp.]